MNDTLVKYFDQVKSSLVCKHCGERFREPVLLRCGCVACRDCIISNHITICCKKKVTEKDAKNKYHFMADIIDQVETIEALRDQMTRAPTDDDPNILKGEIPYQFKKNHEGPMIVLKNDSNAPDSSDTIIPKQSNNTSHEDLMDELKNAPGVIDASGRDLEDVSHGQDRQPAIFSSLDSTVDGSQMCLSCPDEGTLYSEPLLVEPTQRTTQGGLWDSPRHLGEEEFPHTFDVATAGEENEDSFEKKKLGRYLDVSVVPNTSVDVFVRPIESPGVPPTLPVLKRADEDFILTASSATLSPTQIVGEKISDISIQKQGMGVVPSTFLMENADVVVSTFSPDTNLPVAKDSIPGNVIADTYINIHPDVTPRHRRERTEAESCETAILSRKDQTLCGMEIGCRPHSPTSQSSLYNVPSSIEQSEDNRRIERSSSVDSPSTPACRIEKEAILLNLERDVFDDNIFADSVRLKNCMKHNCDREDPQQSLTQGYQDKAINNLQYDSCSDRNAIDLEWSANEEEKRAYQYQEDKPTVPASMDTVSGSLQSSPCAAVQQSNSKNNIKYSDAHEEEEDAGSDLYEVSSNVSDDEKGKALSKTTHVANELFIAGTVGAKNGSISSMYKKQSEYTDYCSTVDGQESSISSWAKNDNKLLNKLLDMLPDKKRDFLKKDGSVQNKRLLIPSNSWDEKDKKSKISTKEDWMDGTSESNDRSIFQDDEKKCAETASTESVSIPKFSFLYSASLQYETKILQLECESKGIFSSIRGKWLYVDDITAQSSPFHSPTDTPSHSALLHQVSAHVVFLEAEKCNLAAKNISSPEENIISQCKRTKTFLKGICMGYWMIDAQRWLKACLRDGKVVDLTRYEVSRAIGSPLTSAPARARLSPRLINDPSRSVLFQNFTLLIKNCHVENLSKQRSKARKNTILERRDIIFMIYYGGGCCREFPSQAEDCFLCDSCIQLNQSHRTNSVVIINCDPEVKKRKLAPKQLMCFDCHEDKCLNLQLHTAFPEVSIRWLVDSLSSFELQTFDDYLV